MGTRSSTQSLPINKCLTRAAKNYAKTDIKVSGLVQFRLSNSESFLLFKIYFAKDCRF